MLNQQNNIEDDDAAGALDKEPSPPDLSQNPANDLV